LANDPGRMHDEEFAQVWDRNRRSKSADQNFADRTFRNWGTARRIKKI
jgi:hypothetical protein